MVIYFVTEGAYAYYVQSSNLYVRHVWESPNLCSLSLSFVVYSNYKFHLIKNLNYLLKNTFFVYEKDIVLNMKWKTSSECISLSRNDESPNSKAKYVSRLSIICALCSNLYVRHIQESPNLCPLFFALKIINFISYNLNFFAKKINFDFLYEWKRNCSKNEMKNSNVYISLSRMMKVQI